MIRETLYRSETKEWLNIVSIESKVYIHIHIYREREVCVSKGHVFRERHPLAMCRLSVTSVCIVRG